MTIVYLIDYDLMSNSGVIQKIKQNALQWGEKGHEVYFVSSATMAIYDAKQNIIFQGMPVALKFGRLGTAVRLMYNSYFMGKLLKKIKYDLIYMRYRLYMPFFNKLLKQNIVIMEINGDDKLEYKLHSKLTHYYNKITRRLILRHVDAFVSVSIELKERFMYLKKPIEVIANGIDHRQYTPKRVNNVNPILVFIATPNQPWQGLDKILSMAKYFVEYQFYIIGTEGKNNKNIEYFGFLSQEESTKVIQRCDIGIGTLSLYKQGLNEASPLKTRQYLACGLPIIYAYEDTDMPNDISFGLRLENSENNINYNDIKKFVDKVFKNENIRLEARKFSEDILSYDKKENLRLSFFRKVLNEK